MTESGWHAIGRIAKLRRERMGLNQEDLADYGGPKVSTVGKFERAVGDGFPTRTQQQMERALGWTRGTVQDAVQAVESGNADVKELSDRLVDEDLPDLEELRPKTGGELIRQFQAKRGEDFGDPEGIADVSELSKGFANTIRFLDVVSHEVLDAQSH